MHANRLHPRRQRRFTWVALVAWVFAVAVASANACLAAVPASPAAGHAQHDHSHESHPHESHPHESHPHESHPYESHPYEPHSHQSPDAGKAGCLKFCDDESSALSKKGASGPDLLAPCTLLEGLEIPPRQQTPGADRLSRARPRSQGPPLVIRLLRLTL